MHNAHNKMMGYLVVAGVAVAVGFLLAGTSLQRVMPVLLALGCLLMMIFMMRGMHGGHGNDGGHDHHPAGPATDAEPHSDYRPLGQPMSTRGHDSLN